MSWRPRLVPLVVLLAAQAAIVGGYLAVEWARTPAPKAFRYERLDAPVPDVVLETPGRGVVRLGSLARKGPIILHFWATWCAPCREELPGLLALDSTSLGSSRVRVVAASADDSWHTIRRYFGGRLPRAVMSAPAGARTAFDNPTLPESYLVVGRTVRARFRGPRDWSAREARTALARLTTEQTARNPSSSSSQK